MPRNSHPFFHRLRRFLSQSGVARLLLLRRPVLPRTLYPDDVYLVSFPKSGNTWLRFLIGNILTENRCDFGSLDEIVPDTYRHLRECDNLARPRFMKSHLPHNARMSRVVYLVRDGRDVAVSLFYYLIKIGKLEPDAVFGNYLNGFNRGDFSARWGTWNSHVLSWLDHWSERYLLVRYEDLRRDTGTELKRILDFVGLPRTASEIASAVSASSFNTMRALEKEQESIWHGFAGARSGISFMRSGRAGGWKSMFSPTDEQAFVLYQGEALRRLNYAS